MLLQQQESLTEQFNLRNMPTINSLPQINKVIDYKSFSYLKISNAELVQPITYEDKNVNILSFLLPIPTTSVFSKHGDQLIEVKAKNNRLLALTKQILIIIYLSLIAIFLILNGYYYLLFKGIESKLIKEITDEAPAESSFSKVTAQLQEQKRTFHLSLQQQEKQISQLAQQIHMDNLTGLSNRHAFRKDLTEILTEEELQKHAVLFIIRASELTTINSQRGFQYGDDYIVNIANILYKIVGHQPTTSIYRISGSDFALMIKDMNIKDAQNIAKILKVQFDHYQILNDLNSVAYSGISPFVSGQLPEQVLARTDMALAKAQTSGVNHWVLEQHDNEDTQFGQQHWRSIIEEVISTRALMLLRQPIQAIHRNMKGYQEIFTRFVGVNNNMIPTDTIFAMAQRVDLIVKLEQLILETVISQCRHKSDEENRWGVNITGSAIQNSSFIVWLERLLLRETNIAANLIFEMQEEILDSNLVASKRVFDMLKRTGSRSAICNFGKGVGSFRLFKELKPDFVKIDASLINNIERDSANQQFVRMIIDVAHRMDCKVIAEGIEHLGQKQILESMYVDGIQGFLIARPSPF